MMAREVGGCALDVAALSDVGTERDGNEDSCGVLVERPGCAVLVVADGVSSAPGGEVASQMAVEVLLRAYREEPVRHPAGQRLYRAAQQANIEIHDRAIAVPELRGMATTVTAAALEDGELTAVHVGDSRLYLLRGDEVLQLTKDHTVAAERVRFGLLGAERARTHPDRSVLTRAVGRELIVSRDRLTRRLAQGDVLVLCTDGLYNVLGDDELAPLVHGLDAAGAARALVRSANGRGTPDNVTAAVVRVTGPVAERPAGVGLAGALRRLLGSRRGVNRSP
jgi:PPM family protein phosphatase